VKPDPRLQVIGFNHVRCRYTVDWVNLKPGPRQSRGCRKCEVPRTACGQPSYCRPPLPTRFSEGP
jgi:hypothetical protein